MRKIIADIHTHTIASGHAYGTIREMAQAAASKKLKILGLTEHAPGIRAVHRNQSEVIDGRVFISTEL